MKQACSRGGGLTQESLATPGVDALGEAPVPSSCSRSMHTLFTSTAQEWIRRMLARMRTHPRAPRTPPLRTCPTANHARGPHPACTHMCAHVCTPPAAPALRPAPLPAEGGPGIWRKPLSPLPAAGARAVPAGAAGAVGRAGQGDGRAARAGAAGGAARCAGVWGLWGGSCWCCQPRRPRRWSRCVSRRCWRSNYPVPRTHNNAPNPVPCTHNNAPHLHAPSQARQSRVRPLHLC